jgi:hypothetical protein
MFEVQQCMLNILQTETEKVIGENGKHSAVDRQTDRQLDCCSVRDLQYRNSWYKNG